MIKKASGCSALLLVTGLFALCVSPIQATPDSNGSASNAKTAPVPLHRAARHNAHHKSYARRKLHNPASKTDTSDNDKPEGSTVPMPDSKIVTADAAANDEKALPQMSPSIANANAQLLLAGVQMNATAAIPSGNDRFTTTSDDPPAPKKADGDTFLVAADQLNDVDRSLREANQPASTAATPPPAVPAPTAATNPDANVWDQTSLIGKVFIGFGALLTMASAARMFMA